nr:nucleotide-binding alpha-beta plait domain-containing protein [Tanacetum cinerariifolium]
MTNSYAHVVKGNQVQNVGMEECPNMVLDETCLNHEEFSLRLLGKVKEFASLTNLKVVLGKEDMRILSSSIWEDLGMDLDRPHSFVIVYYTSQRSKEDDVQKISTSVFVTNFRDGYGAKDLWSTCKLYGHVVDVFIPDRRTKAGKKFGFVRFIKVLDIDRLINNLCTVCVGRNKIHANVAKFQREPLHKQSNKVNKKRTNNVNHGAKGMTNSYAHVVKRNQVQNVGMEECPNIVLYGTCLNHEDFSLRLLGKVKEFASLTNLKVVLGKLKYIIW